MLTHIRQGHNSKDRRLAELIAGFDMVNEEDFTAEISTFAELILQHQHLHHDCCEGSDMATFFHCGETHNRNGQNLHDAIMLGTKRIGHGFQLALFPYL